MCVGSGVAPAGAVHPAGDPAPNLVWGGPGLPAPTVSGPACHRRTVQQVGREGRGRGRQGQVSPAAASPRWVGVPEALRGAPPSLHCMNLLERIHLNYLRHILLGVGKNIAGDILRHEASSPPYHVHWTILIFRLWNSLQSNDDMMAITIWKDNIKLFLKGCRNCWSYKVLKFAFESNITKFNPDDTYYSQHVLDAICTFTFDENTVRNCINCINILASVPQQHLVPVL